MNNSVLAGMIVGAVVLAAAGSIVANSDYNPMQEYATVVSVEQLVGRDVVEASPERTRLFGFEVDLLVEAPGGARPGSAPPLYEDDDAWFAANAGDPAVALLEKI